MESTDGPEPLNLLRALGAFLIGSEADGITACLAGGVTLSQALIVVPAPRRPWACEFLSAAGLGPQVQEHSVVVLRAVAGVAFRIKDVAPVWIAPAGVVGNGTLIADVFILVGGVNTPVVRITYNPQPTSVPWAAPVDPRARRPGVSMRLYLDTQAVDRPSRRPEGRRGYREQNHDQGSSSRLSTGEIAQRLRGTAVMRTRIPKDDGRAVTSHAKFLSIDHHFLLVGSVNFPYSTEERNVELDLCLDDPALAHSVEKQMRDLEETVYEPVC